jgi:hypothetical protein
MSISDSNNDGVIELECKAERDFVVDHGTILSIVIDVDASWSSTDMVDTNAIFTAEVEPDLDPVQVNQVFPTGQAGVFSGSAVAPLQPVVESGNTVKVSANVMATGPPGFIYNVTIVSSIDATVIPTTPAPTFDDRRDYLIVVASLGLLATFALRKRFVRAASSGRSDPR